MTASTNIPFAIQKFWQTDPCGFLMMLRPLRKDSFAYKKIFISLDAMNTSQPIRITTDKPKVSIKPSGHLSNLFRKHLAHSVLQEIFLTRQNHIIFVLRRAPDDNWYLLVQSGSAHNIQLIDNKGCRHLFMGQDKTYTKKALVNSELLKELQSKHQEINIIASLQDTNEPQINTTSTNRPASESTYIKAVRHKIKRRIKTLKKSLQKELAHQITDEKIQNLIENATQLQSFAYAAIIKGDWAIIPASVAHSENDLKIPIDPQQSLGDNINSYFNKAKRMRRGLHKQKQHLEQLQKNLQELESMLHVLSTDPASEEAHKIYQKWSTDTTRKTPHVMGDQERKGYRCFWSLDQSAKIFVGINAKDNDALTKSAQSNDYWFHAVAGSGAHVIVPIRLIKDRTLTPQAKRSAMILALHFSRFRQDQAGEVYIARKAQIKKQKGMPPGLWNVERCQTEFIRYRDEEIKQILNQPAEQ